MAATDPFAGADMYALMVAQVRDYALFVLDPTGHIRSWNTGARRIKGYTAEEIIGRHFSVFYTADAVARRWPEEELRIATREGRFEDEGWRVRKDGSRFWANVVITTLRSEEGQLLGFSKITRDLTDRKRQEEALRQTEERLRLLIEGVVDYAIYMLDPEGMVTSWNVGAERIKGYSREEILGKHVSRFYTDEDVHAGKPWEELAIARRDGRAEDEGWRVRKDGKRFWARVVVSCLYDADGQLRGFAKVTQDLTDRRHMQDLEKAATHVNEFIAMLAHELRNPLAPIRSAVDLMGKLPAEDPAQKTLRDTLDRQSAQLARIVDDMIDIARVTRGSFSIANAPTDLAEVARRALETAAPLIEAGRHRVDVALPAEPLMVDGDVHRLTQLLANLLNNAARFMAPSGEISVRGRLEGGWATVQVRDIGRGIERHMIGRIFDMFVHGRPVLERVGEGLGVGLALARRIAEAHGGTLTAASEGEGRGAQFTLRLPAAAAVQKPPRGQAAEGRPAPVMRAQRVLVVDDNVDAAATLQLLLNSLGHETRAVHDGIRALEVAAEFVPDIVLLDIGLPGLDGYEVARRLRALRRERPLRIIAITGWGQDADRQRSREAGVDVHLVKPVDPMTLTSLLASNNGHTLH